MSQKFEKVMFKLEKIETEGVDTFAKSKILGSPVFPKGFLEKKKLEDDLFIAQLNLKEFKGCGLPEKGFLYLFLKVDNFPYDARVFYSTEEEPFEVYDDINEGFDDFGDYQGYFISKTDEESGFSVLSAANADLDFDSAIKGNIDDYVCLFEMDSISLPSNVLTLGQADGWYIFLIKKDDLIKKDFSKVVFLSYGS